MHNESHLVNVLLNSWFLCDVVNKSHIPELKMTFPSEVLVLSDVRLFRNLTFYNGGFSSTGFFVCTGAH